LTSELAGQPADAERLRSELEQTVQQLVDVQIETSAYDLKRQEAQLRRAQERHQRLAGSKDELVRERLKVLMQAAEQPGTPEKSQPMDSHTEAQKHGAAEKN
jgi:hypothetical protein